MSKKKSKHTKNKKHTNKSYIFLAFICVFILIIIICSKNKTEQIQNKQTELIINNENITQNLQDKIINENGKTYMSFDDIKNYIDKNLYKETETNLIITTGDKKVAAMKQGEDNIEINGSNQKNKNIVEEKDGKEYIAISELENVYDYNFTYIESSNIAVIDSLNKQYIKACAKKNIKIKKENKIMSKTIDKVQKGKWLVYISEENGIAKVRTQNGKIGYVKKNLLDNFVTEREDFNVKDEENKSDETLEYDITKKDITTFEKRKKIINLILQETIKNDKMYVTVIYKGNNNDEYERFKIESVPVLRECGIKVNI